jgi:hypothetical protein
MKRYNPKELRELERECQWCGYKRTDERSCGNDPGGITNRENPCWFQFIDAAKDANDTITELKAELKAERRAYTRLEAEANR